MAEFRIKPDIEELLAVIRRSSMPKRVHNIELFLDEEIKQAICERFEIGAKIDSRSEFTDVSREIELHRFLGYDVFRIDIGSDWLWTLPRLATEDTTGTTTQKRDERNWTDEHTGPVQSWEDFEKYPWPRVSNVDFSKLEWLDKNLPENMGCYDLTAHILEIVTWLFGYETLCLKLFDDLELVEAVCERVGQFYVELTKAYCDFSCNKVVWGSDDMGYQTSTVLSPDFLRRNILP
ncbi:MAG: hypothetical protein DRP62_01885 [Planctomycetota bacterium]|nr:MAG: hypothetical protein DRP62_01885 [Planctomycetota bacterium]